MGSRSTEYGLRSTDYGVHTYLLTEYLLSLVPSQLPFPPCPPLIVRDRQVRSNQQPCSARRVAHACNYPCSPCNPRLFASLLPLTCSSALCARTHAVSFKPPTSAPACVPPLAPSCLVLTSLTCKLHSKSRPRSRGVPGLVIRSAHTSQFSHPPAPALLVRSLSGLATVCRTYLPSRLSPFADYCNPLTNPILFRAPSLLFHHLFPSPPLGRRRRRLALLCLRPSLFRIPSATATSSASNYSVSCHSGRSPSFSSRCRRAAAFSSSSFVSSSFI